MKRVLLMLGLAAAGSAWSQTLVTGLVGYWNFDAGSGATLSDFSGQGNHGALLNGPAWTTGHSGGALAFDGSDDRVQIGSPVGLPVGNASRTIVAWVKLTGEVSTSNTSYNSGPGNRYQSVVSWGTPLANNQLISFERGADQHPGSLALLGWNNDRFGSTNSAITAGTWVHAAVTYDATTSTVSFFLNGVADGSSTGGAYNTTLNASGLVIGGVDANDGWHLNFFGAIDELYLYNRALSVAEINQLMASPIPEPAATVALMGLLACAAAGWVRGRRRLAA